MSYVRDTKKPSNKKILTILAILFALTGYGVVVFAVPPIGGYTPGQTLDPLCSPGDTDCLVVVQNFTFDSPLINSAGVISIPAASSGVDGYLLASDWNRFDSKQDSVGVGTSFEYLRGDNTWQTLDTLAVIENGNLYWTNNRFDTRLAITTSIPNLQTVGTITSGIWHGAQITDAYISDSITASNYIPLSQKGVANGVATLDGAGKVPSSQLSSFSLSDTFVVNSEAEMLSLLSAELGDVAIRLDENKSYILTTNDPTNIANWQQIITPLDFVLSVNGQYGAVNLTTTNIPEGLNLYYTDQRVDDYLNTVKGVAGGVASLDANGKIPSSQLGSIILNETHVVVDIPAMLAITGAANGDLAVVTSTSQTYVLADDNDPSNINSWVEIVNGSPVTSVNGQVGTVNLTTTNIAEGSNQYFTNYRARNAFTATGPLTYDAVSGVFGITKANAVNNGYLSAVDWNTFNSKQNALIFGNLTASSNPEITITGGTGAVIGTGLNISIPDASDTVRGLVTTGSQNFAGVKNFIDGISVGDTVASNMFSVGVGGLFQIDSSGNIVRINNVAYSWPASQGGIDSVLVNDGSGNLSWGTNGVVSLNGLTDAVQTFTTSTTGTDFTISSSGGIHTFNFPTASATARGALSSTKYIEFNNKPNVDTTYNNIYVSSISGGTALNGAGGGINNIIMGYQAADTLSTGNNNTLLGYQSGKNVTTGVTHSFFAGYQSGLSATSATNSIFIGRQAGSGAASASFASFLGRSAGLNATSAQYSVFIGDNAGNTANGSNNATFIGQNAGYQATIAPYTVAIGTSAGYQASGTTTANFIGYGAGYQASDADYSNFFGRLAGNTATSAAYSNFFGYQAGSGAANAANSIFIGKNAGLNDTVNNTVSGSSIVIGDSAGTGGFSNSIAIGASAVNTSANQLLIGSSYTKLNVRGIDYTWPSAQAAGSGYVLTNDGAGGLSWSTGLSIGGSNTQLQYNNNGNLGGITGVTYDGANFDARDNVFRIVDNADTTKRAIFEVSGIDNGTTRTYTFPNAAGTIALTSDITNYTFSTGLSNSGNIITNNLSTGISGGQSVIGGTASGNNLTLSSTLNATKGKILFGTSAYDEVNNRLGIGTNSPTTPLDVRGNATFGTAGVPSLVTVVGDASNTALRIGNSNSAFYYDIYREGLATGLLTFQGNQSGATGYLFKNETASGKYFTFSSAGRFGINVTSPSANLHLPAGTATASTAPLKFTSGTNLATPEAGAIEYNGTSFFGTPSSGTRYNFLMNNLGLAGGQTIVGGTASGENLTLSSTSHATKGKIIFGTSAYDEVNNRLGIGTASPSALLNANGPLSVARTSGTNATQNDTIFRITNSTGGPLGGTIDFGQWGANYGWIQSRNAGDYSLNYSLLLNPNGGNIGIGNTSPSYPLDVTGDIRTTTKAYFGTSGANIGWDTNYSRLSIDPVANYTAIINRNTIGTIMADSSNNIQFTFSPISTTNKAMVFNGYYNYGYNSQFATASVIEHNAGKLIFSANTGISGSFTPNNIMTLDGATSRVGIGTTSPQAPLHITNGLETLRLQGNGTYISFFNGTGARTGYLQADDLNKFLNIASENSGNIRLWTSSNERLRIDTSGNIGIGTTTLTYRLNVSNTGTAGIVGSFTNSDGTCTLDPGDVSGWSCPSDLNLKKDIETLTSGSLDNILALRPVTYRLINEDGLVDPSTGLIAQEVQTIFPKLVKTQIDGTLSLNYGGLTPYMISAIQEMNLKITTINNVDTPNTWRDALIAWFENAANGIQKIFAREVHTETLCVGQTCLNETQVQQILQTIGSSVPLQNTPLPSTDPGNSGDNTGNTGTDDSNNTPEETPSDTGSGDTGITDDSGSSGDTGSIPTE